MLNGFMKLFLAAVQTVGKKLPALRHPLAEPRINEL
jgi:hypothetical protein